MPETSHQGLPHNHRDIISDDRASAIAQYLDNVTKLNSESARSHRFAMLLQQLLGIDPNFIEDYSRGIETYIKNQGTDRLIRGEADNLFGNLIIEFEKSIPGKRKEAEEQIRRYCSILWSGEAEGKRNPYIGMATDGVRFITYSLIAEFHEGAEIRPESVRLEELENSDWRIMSADQIYFWLDRYLLRREKIIPTSPPIVRDFGIKSHAYQIVFAALANKWESLASESDFKVIYETWDRYLRIVYGSDETSQELFVRHTYLATLAKLMAWQRISGDAALPSSEAIRDMLGGQLFKRYGIENFLEEDFFSWLARSQALSIGVQVVKELFSILTSYDLSALSEDVLKSLYEQLVDPSTRHDLGEYYTPDWLAHRMVRRLLDENPEGRVLDPACGSGTFLYMAIKEKRDRLGDTQSTLKHILKSVYGADIHPLAVITAKTNYILALGNLVSERKSALAIPIYLSDTIRLPQQFMSGPQYEIPLEDKTVYVERSLLKDMSLYDRAVELAAGFAKQNIRRPITMQQFKGYLTAQSFDLSDNQSSIEDLFQMAVVLKQFMDARRDSIWAYVLKNTFKPLFFERNKFDYVIGNPPWIAYRVMPDVYQKFLKQEIIKEYRLLVGSAKLITHMEVATLFYVRSADLYLKRGGKIAFVLPYSVFTAAQHDSLRRRTYRLKNSQVYTITTKEAWNCEGVRPLFENPACVLIGEKEPIGSPLNPIQGEILTGRLSRKNASLEETQSDLKVSKALFEVSTRGGHSGWASENSNTQEGHSFYKRRFAQGATILPRPFWFVRIKPSSLGVNPDFPAIETAPPGKSGPVADYRKVKIEGNIESRFLYNVLVGDDILPFVCRSKRLAVVPTGFSTGLTEIVSADQARERGLFGLENWLRSAELHWSQIRGSKASRMSIYGRIDHLHGLTSQNALAPFRVVYPNFQRVAIAAIVRTADLITTNIGSQVISVSGLFIDHALYYHETDDINEAYYLCACLNSAEIDYRLGFLRRKGQKMRPNVHKKIFDVAPIPQYRPENKTHSHLAELGRLASEKAAKRLTIGELGGDTALATARREMRSVLRPEMESIDKLVKQILK